MSLLAKDWGLKKYGNCYGIGPTNRPWATIGPDWPLALCVTVVILIVEFVFALFMASQVGELVRGLGCVVINGTAFCYFYSVLRNPGLVLDDEVTSGKRCEECELFILPTTDHCSSCGVCVKELDHHCVFMGKCVGRGNLWSFYGFLMGVGLTFMYCAVWAFSIVQGSKLLRNTKKKV